MVLEFIGGPSDGYSANCPLCPPPVFYLPTATPLMASVYLFDSVQRRQLRYAFHGYQELSRTEALHLFEPRTSELSN